MPMLSKQQLIDWMEDTRKIIRVAEVSVYNLKRIHAPKSALEKELLKNSFFQQYELQLRYSLVIELCKLFVNSDIERRNFRKLCNRLKLERYDSSLKAQLRKNRDKKGLVRFKKEVIEMLNPLLIELDKRKDMIFRMKGLRDRAIAHTDPYQVLPEVSFEELDDLCMLAGRIYQEIVSGIFGNDIQLEVDEDAKIDPILRTLVAGMHS